MIEEFVGLRHYFHEKIIEDEPRARVLMVVSPHKDPCDVLTGKPDRLKPGLHIPEVLGADLAPTFRLAALSLRVDLLYFNGAQCASGGGPRRLCRSLFLRNREGRD